MRKGWSYLTTIALVALWATTLRAQQTSGPAVGPSLTAAFPAAQAGTGQTPGSAANPSEGQPAAPSVMPPLSGAQVLAPTFGSMSESYWVPALACTESASTNPSGLNRGSGIFSTTTCDANLTLQRVGRHSQLNLDLTGGGFYYNRPYETGTNKQYGTDGELGLVETVNGRRWNWLLGDSGSYLPAASLGLGGLSGISSFAGGMGGGALSSAPALNGALAPNQSIYGGMSRRFSDMAVSELTYIASPRSTLTATAMFGTLQFFSPGTTDERSWTVMGGYNRTFGRNNEFALNYEEMHFNFGPIQPGMIDHAASVFYGRQISPKVTVELSVAPSARGFSGLSAGSTTNLFVGTYDSLLYRAQRWDGTLRFDRALTGGAGVLAGAGTISVGGGIGRQLSRRVHGMVNVNYAQNRSLVQSTSGAPQATYDYIQAGANLTHELGQHMSLYLNYSVQRQTSNTPLCENVACSTLYFRQVGGFGINWHSRPLKID